MASGTDLDQSDSPKFKLSKRNEIHVNRTDDKAHVVIRCIFVMSDKVIIIDNGNLMFKVYNNLGSYLFSVELKKITYGITKVAENKFATCGFGYAVFLWTLSASTITYDEVSYRVDHDADAIVYDGTYYCVLHSFADVIAILDKSGNKIRKIKIKEAFENKIEYAYDVAMDDVTHNIFVPCVEKSPGVLCISVEGVPVWFVCIPKSAINGIVDVNGVLCMTDRDNYKLHLVTKGGYHVKELENNREITLLDKPDCIQFDEEHDVLFINYISCCESRHIVSTYNVNTE